MESLYLLIPLSVVLVFVIGVAFWWSVRNGQFDDMEGPAYRILMDDDHSPEIGGRNGAKSATHSPGSPVRSASADD